MSIEPVSADSLNELVNLVVALWPECSFEEERESYQRLLTATDEVCYLAKEGTNYFGFIHLTLRTDYVEGASHSPVAYVEGLYVKPEFQHQGIGRYLMQAGEGWAREKHCQEMASDTELDNAESLAFHQKLGFEEANRIVCLIKTL
ncbi:GNAT family N-acetyltransferase [Siphonobacter sp. SORGH_AS_0500]|uniref:aminoglycoside 6'-N-acetyltransferase n=1 Tax=Siphonobacter sp. SORGH_AS_0500 TaxID=1864824 RepID=UPI000CB3EB6B|nr:aminoglycoside 6'-N-acetyltransferase [Siphonobacter sp. SORGH_AS_0500]PKK37783.1 GNAT family N-acetyltransferase [Siphonobacter sp. SORGH_AS_0500]